MHPFLQYDFLSTLESTGSVSSESGWQPCHLAFYKDDVLVAVMPNYIKGHSYGEYVFDWAWAEAYQRHGLEYYPKSLSAIPMTPATGPRLLSVLSPEKSKALLRAGIEWVEQNQLSSWHINFVPEVQRELYSADGLIARSDIQFHWRNQSAEGKQHGCFDDFLAELKPKKRKNIRRERKAFAENEAEWSFDWLNGETARDEDWQTFYRMYRNTFDKKGGWAQLAPDFFAECAKALPKQTLLLMVKHRDQPVAGAFFMRSDTTLYGRYWGCFEDIEFLHFETCYYRGIEYAIEHGLRTFEPGAQGEHKLARGFLPVRTYSYHYVSRPEFRDAIANAVAQEEQWLDIRHREYMEHSPYKGVNYR